MTEAASTRVAVVCPQCGTPSTVDPVRRESTDFCLNTTCDFPLFWADTDRVIRDLMGGDESLRRLPGAQGQAVVASVPCPHCQELNLPEAVRCFRCNGLMVIVVPPPVQRLPEPVLPPPAVVKKSRWWIWLLIALLVISALVAGIWYGVAVND